MGLVHGTCSYIFGKYCYDHEALYFCPKPSSCLALNLTAEFRHHLIDSGHSLAVLLSVVMNKVCMKERADKSGNCDSRAVRIPHEVVEFEDVITQATI